MIAEDWWKGLTDREQFIITQMLTALSTMRGDEFAEHLVKVTRRNMDAIYPRRRSTPAPGKGGEA